VSGGAICLAIVVPGQNMKSVNLVFRDGCVQMTGFDLVFRDGCVQMTGFGIQSHSTSNAGRLEVCSAGLLERSSRVDSGC